MAKVRTKGTKPEKVKQEKQYTRMQAERALSAGMDPTLFLDMNDPFAKKDAKNPGRTVNHGNYHVRAKAWRKMGMPLPEKDVEKFLTEVIHVNPDRIAGFVKTGQDS